MPPVAQMAALNVEPEPEPARAASHTGQGVCAVVLYEYEAAEDNEMTLVEGELVEQIEEVDEGWWSGVVGGVKNGLFPSNYVELVEVEQPAAEEEAAPPPPLPPPPSPPPAPATAAPAVSDSHLQRPLVRLHQRLRQSTRV
ncbi:SH3 domain-containing protein [Hygrophoropsis aurantiaca]|uniref:SH3 domain-containing protein n=1 Tax=Hygrophoropsis aurantiaca TaxID=72124 RepID=A0ACB7ZVE7_9AGAM|nr:SH3 domain-containing protein [Hygrophoropsis aurantiaca]